MLHRHGFSEMGSQQAQQLGGQSDLRHKKHGALAFLQAAADQLQIHRSLARAGDAVKQRRPRLRLGQLSAKPVEHLLLVFIQHQRSIQHRRTDLPAAKHRLIRQLQVAQLRQAFDCGHTGTGIVAQLLDRYTADGAHQLQHAFLHGRAQAARRVFHRLLHRGSQGRDLLRFVAAPAQKLCSARDPLLIQQILQRLAELFLLRHRIAQGLFRRLTAHTAEQTKHGKGIRLADSRRFPGAVFRKGIGIFLPEPQARGEHGPDGVIEGAKVPLPDECRQTQHPVIQHRLRIQQPVDGLQLLLAALLQSKDHTFRTAVSLAEGYDYPLAHRRLHPLGDRIGIGLIDGKSCR